MNIIQIVAIGIIGMILSVILKKQVPGIAILIGVAVEIIIFMENFYLLEIFLMNKNIITTKEDLIIS